MEFKALSTIGIAELFEAWNSAFKDYIRTWTKPELEIMLLRRGYAPELSFGAFDNGQLISFTLNAIGTFNNKPTAYDTGTGTIEAYRGQGLATRIFRHALPYLRSAGIHQYLLEVVTSNHKAIAVYKSIGFKPTRQLDYFITNSDKPNLRIAALPAGYSIKQIDLTRYRQEIEQMCDFNLSWQNSFESIARISGSLIVIGGFYNDNIIGYGIIEPSSGDIPQLAVARSFRRKGMGTAILSALLNRNKASTIRIINIDADCKPIYNFLQVSGITQQGSQYEMALAI